MTYFGFSEPELDRLAASLQRGEPIDLAAPERLQPPLVAALQRRSRRRLLWVVTARHELARLHGLGIPVWPGDDEPLHRDLPSPERLRRAQLLEGVEGISLLAAEAGELTVTSPAERRARVVRLGAGNNLSQERLSAQLLAAGYVRGSGPASFERRGDSILVTTAAPITYRIEFFGDEVERILKGSKPVPELELSPVETSGSSSLSEYFDGTIHGPDIAASEPALIRFTPSGSPTPLREFPLFYRHRDRFEVFIGRLLKDGYRITAAAGEDADFAGLVEELGLDLRDDPGDSGWIWSEVRRAHVTARDFDPSPRSVRSPKSLRLGELSPGGLVVHRDYGIGRFLEMIDRETDSVKRTYLRLEFAAASYLYVPVEQLDRLTAYEGAPHPTLSKLAGGEWVATLARLKRVSADIALELLSRYAKRELGIGQRMKPFPEEEARFDQAFAYELTTSQRRVIAEVLADMESERPMDRLVAGDVGFGKTEVAWRAAHRAILNGKQVALIAPTTVLVEQHLATARKRFEDEEVQIVGLSRFQTPAEQKRSLEGLRDGSAQLAIGTHRLLSRDVSFADLGLIVVDEEQRFGVEDKERLRRLYEHVDALTLSATPIPRTLELAFGGIRPMSVIEIAPQGRLPVETRVVPRDEDVWRGAIKRELDRGGQVYVITPRIRRIARLKDKVEKLFPHLEVGIAHGQLPERELSSTMGRFAAGELPILIASTIVENGLDLPTANTMLIDDPTLLGLAELYQLRGRIGRSGVQGYCYLIQPGERLAPDAAERIQALMSAAAVGGGLEIAIRDLELRGSGNILGREQHGYIMGVGLALYAELLEEARAEILAGRRLQSTEALVDLPLETALPDTVAGTPSEQIEIYRQFEGAEDEEALDRLYAELTQKFGLHGAFENLATIRRLKLRSLGTPVAGIRSLTRPRASGGTRDYLVFTLEREPSEEEISVLTDLKAGWSAKGIELRLPLDLTESPATEEALRALESLASAGLTAREAGSSLASP